MKPCNQKKCLHYEPEMENNCDNEKIFEKCDAKHYNKKAIIQMDMNEIIDNIAGYYPEDIFRETTIKETNEFPQNMRKYIGRVSASMARLTCKNIKRELKQYFEEET